MRKLLLTTILVLGVTSPALADWCSPEIEVKASQDEQFSFGGYNDSQRDDQRFSVSLKWDFGGSHTCSEMKAKARKSQAEAIEKELLNMERMIKLCKLGRDNKSISVITKCINEGY